MGMTDQSGNFASPSRGRINVRIRHTLILLHTILAAFFLPMGIMYAITGGLYGLGNKGSYDTTEYKLILDQPTPTELSSLVALAEKELDARGLAYPTGGASVKKAGTSFYLEWTGSHRDVQIAPTQEPNVASLKIKNTDAHRFFVQLHKAKGATVFKWFAGVWMVGLVLLFISGGVMAFMARPYRVVAGVSAVLGLVVFAALAWVS